MNDAPIGEENSGALTLVCNYFQESGVWPPPEDTCVLERTFTQGNITGQIALVCLANGRLEVRASHGDLPHISAFSPILVIKGRSWFPILIEYEWEKSYLGLKLFGSVKFTNSDELSTVEFEVPIVVEELPEILQVGDTVKVRTERAKRVADYSPTKKQNAIRELVSEVTQLRLILGTFSDAPEILRSAITIIRKLVADRNRGVDQSLLLTVAGLLNQPLTVYSNSDEKLPPVAPDVVFPSILSPAPQWGFRFEMDIETWLDMPGTVIATEAISNRNTIKGIADKIGAHVDLDKRVLIDLMAAGSSGVRPDYTHLHEYIVHIGLTVLRLGDTLLAMPASQ
ncbi:hypothetical protein [Rhizobium ruizarguesonis]|uniref:hypothetical protein n=1 Tax=Rhizobium ruizarguesonis TaxID=2081791 RepID=UPI0013BEC277|nr:hypothetical protein [Rhizobium ruizarguesonis]NEJ02540.1 hypothetical protein [Rhizobium ruizarguesonis]NEJ35342.1 hypothetical protein [Rhizobium ruizarguesonis]